MLNALSDPVVPFPAFATYNLVPSGVSAAAIGFVPTGKVVTLPLDVLITATEGTIVPPTLFSFGGWYSGISTYACVLSVVATKFGAALTRLPLPS